MPGKVQDENTYHYSNFHSRIIMEISNKVMVMYFAKIFIESTLGGLIWHLLEETES